MTPTTPARPPLIASLRDRQFGFALLLGPLFWLVLAVPQGGVPASVVARLLEGVPALVLLALVYPVLEEIVFRGAVQDFLGRRWVARRGSPLTRANLVTSILFAATHIAWLGDPAAGAVFFPSLVFGYFRERHATLASPIALHIFYNAGLFLIFGVPPPQR
jgi:membrane protease YdiL (CAAX protease family)